MRPRIATVPGSLALAPIVALVLAVVLAGCGAPAQGTAGTVAVTDLLGRKVPVPETVERVVAIGPGALRLYVYAGTPDRLVGVERFESEDPRGRPYLLANPSLTALPAIGQGGPNNAPDPERILAVAPDVIFSTYATDRAAADELAARTGVPVIVLSYGAPAVFGQTVLDSLRLIGTVTGQSERAATAVDLIQRARHDLERRTTGLADSARPSVYLGGLGARGAHGIESTQGRYALLDVLHARNVVDETGKSGSLMIDKEKLLAWDPDVIVIDGGGLASVLQDYRKNPSFYASLTAVRNGTVYRQLPYNHYSTNIDTAIADAYYLGSILYPAAFSDIDPEQKADEIYRSLLGRPLYAQMATSFGGFGALTLA